MDVIKTVLGGDGINLLSDECLSTYLDDFNIFDPDCAKGNSFSIEIIIKILLSYSISLYL